MGSKKRTPIAILITDTHCSDQTVDINLEIFSQVILIAKTIGVDKVFHGGDVFTSRKGQPEVVLNTFKAILDLFEDHEIRLFCISGNHDKVNGNATSSYLNVYEKHPSFKLMKEDECIIIGAVGFHFLSYYDEKLTYPDKLLQTKRDLDRTLYNILITHCAINGVRTNSGVAVADELSPDLFKDFDLVLVGHYHDRQELSPKIVYVGSPYQANFGEDEHKGCTILYDDGGYEFVNLEFPKYTTIKYEAKDLDTKALKAITKAKMEGNVRVKITGKLQPEQTQLIEHLNDAGVRLEIASTEISPLEIGQGQTQFSSSDILLTYDEWVKEKNVQQPEFGKQLLTKVL